MRIIRRNAWYSIGPIGTELISDLWKVQRSQGVLCAALGTCALTPLGSAALAAARALSARI